MTRLIDAGLTGVWEVELELELEMKGHGPYLTYHIMGV